MTIQQATEKYEVWLAGRIRVDKEDLKLKHRRMREGPFSFLRATFYRWMQRWPQLCPDLAKAPAVLSVGDLHVENFGTWRDAEGRLIWGINDFDEAFELPFTNDLVRLAASALLAVKENGLAIDPEAACDAILEGYTQGFTEGGRPFVLSEHNRWLRDLVTNKLRDPARFWEKLDRLPSVRGAVPAQVLETLKLAMPEPGLPFRVVHRQAGLGTLGRQRFAAIAEWRGGKIAREVKELFVSACVWETKSARAEILYDKIIKGAVRAADPFTRLRNPWVLRRLSPYCSRIELRILPRHKDEEKLLRAMGWETANIHLGCRASRMAVMRDLKKRDSQWLFRAAKIMAEAVRDDWKKWVSRTEFNQSKRIELLVVISIIAVLASFLLPVLASAKAKAHSARCQGNLRQIGIGLAMYADEYRYYPCYLQWQRVPGTVLTWGAMITPYVGAGWTEALFHCPAYRGITMLDSQKGNASEVPIGDLGSYGINGVGAGGGGLGFQYPSTSESAVRNPSDMIAGGDTHLWMNRSTSLINQHFLLGGAAVIVGINRLEWELGRHPDGYPIWGPGAAKSMQQRHGGHFNIIFCDGHCISTSPERLFERSEQALRRWNIDNEAHLDAISPN